MTAVQELIKELEQFKKFPMVDQPTIDAAIDFAELKLETEKQQILSSRLNGFMRSSEGFNGEWPFEGESLEYISKKIYNEEWYNETFKTK